MNNSHKLPKKLLKLTQLSMQSMQKKAGQNTFGGRFGGRMSSPETKLKHLRRHLRRPNPPNRAEHAKHSGASCGSLSHHARGSAAEWTFGCRTWVHPELSFNGKPSPPSLQALKTCTPPLVNTHILKYMFTGVQNYLITPNNKSNITQNHVYIHKSSKLPLIT